MANNLKREFSISFKDLDKLIGLLHSGKNDLNSINSEMKWHKSKILQFQQFIFENLLFDENCLMEFENTPTLDKVIIPKRKFRELYDLIPKDYVLADDWFEEEWYKDAHEDLREFLLELINQNPMFNKKKAFSLSNIDLLINMVFCVVQDKPENLCDEIKTLVKVYLKRTRKDEFDCKDVLLAFDKAFKNYY